MWITPLVFQVTLTAAHKPSAPWVPKRNRHPGPRPAHLSPSASATAPGSAVEGVDLGIRRLDTDRSVDSKIDISYIYIHVYDI